MDDWLSITVEFCNEHLQSKLISDRFISRPPFAWLYDFVGLVHRRFGFPDADPMPLGEHLEEGSKAVKSKLDRQSKLDIVDFLKQQVEEVLNEETPVDSRDVCAGKEAETTALFLRQIVRAAIFNKTGEYINDPMFPPHHEDEEEEEHHDMLGEVEDDIIHMEEPPRSAVPSIDAEDPLAHTGDEKLLDDMQMTSDEEGHRRTASQHPQHIPAPAAIQPPQPMTSAPMTSIQPAAPFEAAEAGVAKYPDPSMLGHLADNGQSTTTTGQPSTGFMGMNVPPRAPVVAQRPTTARRAPPKPQGAAAGTTASEATATAAAAAAAEPVQIIAEVEEHEEEDDDLHQIESSSEGGDIDLFEGSGNIDLGEEGDLAGIGLDDIDEAGAGALLAELGEGAREDVGMTMAKPGKISAEEKTHMRTIQKLISKVNSIARTSDFIPEDVKQSASEMKNWVNEIKRQKDMWTQSSSSTDKDTRMLEEELAEIQDNIEKQRDALSVLWVRFEENEKRIKQKLGVL